MMLFGTKTLSLLFTSMLLSVSVAEGQHGNLRRLSSSSDDPIPPVDLSSAGKYAIMTKTGVTTTGVTSIKGDIGSSPVAVTYYTGFGLTLQGTYSTSNLVGVTGKLYAASHAVPTPNMLIVDIGAMQAAYDNAAGRVDPDFIELGAGNIEGKTLTQGLYKWGTSVGITSSLTFDGGKDDSDDDLSDHVWVLQVAGDVTIGNGAGMVLSGGAQAKNIFWQVAGQTTFGTTTHSEGVFLCKTAIVFKTGSSLNGAALAQTAVTLDAATIVKKSCVTIGCDA